MHEEFMAFVTDEGSYRMVRAAAATRGYPHAVVQQGGLELLGDMLENDAPPRILLLDLENEGDYLIAAQRAISLAGPDCSIIFIGGRNDVTLYRSLIRMNAADYLVKPLSEDTLVQALLNAVQAPSKEEKKQEARGGKIIPVIGTRGGVGATMLTVNMGWYMAHKLKLYTCLLDLDLQFGTAALALDKEPGLGMHAALENPERLDGLLIASSMAQESERLSLLCAEENVDKQILFDGGAALSLLRPVAPDFDIVLVDMPRLLLNAQRRLLDEMAGVVIVCDLSLPSLRDARRIRAYLKTVKPDVLPLIIANRSDDVTANAVDQPTFEKGLEAKIDLILPDDPKSARQAGVLGKSIVEIAADTGLGKSLAAAARLTAGMKDDVTDKKAAHEKSFFRNLMKGGEKASEKRTQLHPEKGRA